MPCAESTLLPSICDFFVPFHPSLFPGFPDHVPAPLGNHLPHHLLLREQHGPGGNAGHVPPRRGRRADRGEDLRDSSVEWTDGREV